MPDENKHWHVYIVHCSNNTFYTGITNDLARRLSEHQTSQGSKYTRSFKPTKILWQEPHPDRSSALKREAQIKRWTRAQKEAFLRTAHASVRTL
ncbi:MAG: GIY-YIG nuclease family protein [Elusimicrobia bacterium]|nr:GIY-YIG nuclease family protein [Elusimicrobiota bacterium]